MVFWIFLLIISWGVLDFTGPLKWATVASAGLVARSRDWPFGLERR